MAKATLALAQVQRDRSAASDAIVATLERKKAEAAAELLRRGGLGRSSEPVAEAIAEVWFGGTATIVDLLKATEPDTEVEGLARDIAGAFEGLEADLKETPALLSHRLAPSPEEMVSMTPAQRAASRRVDAIARALRDIGVRRGADDYAAAVSEALQERDIRGDLDDLARRASEAALAVGSDPDRLARVAAEGVAEARNLGAFLGSWTRTAGRTFDEVEVFGTDEPGNGYRETFVVVASESPIDLAELGRRPSDPRFEQSGAPFEPDPYGPQHREALRIRSRGITLTDDYAPVENLLAPVAATRGTE
jgi:hypothetical protein